MWFSKETENRSARSVVRLLEDVLTVAIQEGFAGFSYIGDGPGYIVVDKDDYTGRDPDWLVESFVGAFLDRVSLEQVAELLAAHLKSAQQVAA